MRPDLGATGYKRRRETKRREEKRRQREDGEKGRKEQRIMRQHICRGTDRCSAGVLHPVQSADTCCACRCACCIPCKARTPCEARKEFCKRCAHYLSAVRMYTHPHVYAVTAVMYTYIHIYAGSGLENGWANSKEPRRGAPLSGPPAPTEYGPRDTHRSHLPSPALLWPTGPKNQHFHWCLLGSSWCLLGASWGGLGVVLGGSWGDLGSMKGR